MFRRNCFGVIIGLGLVVLLSGCSTYKEPTMAMSDTALLKATHGCTVDTVDGETVMHMAVTFGGAVGGNEVRVTPGVHNIVIKHVINNGTWTYTRPLLCEKGHTYIIQPNGMLGGTAIITDATTGQVLQLQVQLTDAATGQTKQVQMQALMMATPGTTVATGTAAAPTTAATAPAAPAVAAPAPSVAVAPAQASGNSEDDDAQPRVGMQRVRVQNCSTEQGAGLKAKADVLLKNVANQPFSFQGVITDANGTPLKDASGEFRGSRTIYTGDDEDTDEYSFEIPCQRIYTWNPLPSAIYVKLVLVDAAGTVRATHALVPYTISGR